MEEMILRGIENLGARVTGPMHFRIYMQPLMASILAVIAGLRDARAGKPAFFSAMLTTRRAEVIREMAVSVGRVFIFAVILDIIYQLYVQRWIYPLETIVTAILLAIVPYFFIRGITDRIATFASRR